MKSPQEVEENVRTMEEGPLTADEMGEVLSLLSEETKREQMGYETDKKDTERYGQCAYDGL
jgi:hypothetical protein